jgi:hypothetical protein
MPPCEKASGKGFQGSWSIWTDSSFVLGFIASSLGRRSTTIDGNNLGDLLLIINQNVVDLPSVRICALESNHQRLAIR